MLSVILSLLSVASAFVPPSTTSSIARRGPSVSNAPNQIVMGVQSWYDSGIRLTTEEAPKEEKKDRLGAGGKGGHQVRNAPKLSEEEQALQTKVMEHQKGAARLSNAEEARSLVQYSTGYGVISTNSKEFAGYPGGGVVGFAPDENGLPVFCFSKISGHTQDLIKNSKASLTVTTVDFKGAADGRVNLLGDITRVPKEEVDSLRGLYKAKHPNAFWVEFGDFLWFRMSNLVHVRFVGGFARAGDITSEEYLESGPDPIMEFATPVAGHMNADHSEATVAMIQHYVGIEVESAMITTLDRLGMTVKCTRNSDSFKLRLPFPKPAESRKDIKDIIVTMTRAAAGAAQEA